MTQYNKHVVITNIHDRQFKYTCDNETGYMNHLKNNPAMCEVIGEYKQYIKPVFDVDAYKNDIDIDAVKTDINMLFPNKSINYAKRESRETKKGIKYSYRLYVDGVKIYSSQIKQLLIDHKLNENPIYDLSIYDKNKVLFLPLTTQKANGGVAPQLCPIDCDIFKCCASYVEEGFEDWNINFPDVKKTKKDDKLLDILKYTDTETLKIAKSLVNECLSLERCNDYTEWLNVGFCLYNIDDSLIDVWDKFSTKGDSYKAGECEKLWGSMKKGSIGMGSLKYWSKMDNVKAYKDIIYKSNYKYVVDALGTDGSHYDVAKVCYNYFKGKLYYDTTSKSYYSVNDDTNIWKKDSEGLCVSHYLSTTICQLFMTTGVKIMNEETDDPILKGLNEERCKKCVKIATKLKDENYTNSIKKSLKSLCAIDNFNCNVLDVNINTFAFSNCLFDLKHKVVRLIEPDDHISTTTGYNFDINVSKDIVKELKNLLRGMFKTDEMYYYLIDVLSMSMFGKNLHQEFYIFNGMGSNGKSILMNLLMLSFGDYCGKVNATTFTKESRGANETSELHACKASRLVVVEEPNENDKLISSRLKEYSGDTVIKTRGLHENAFSFEVMFCMIFFCNQICELSKVDNAIGRRLRLLNFPFKFCDNPMGDNEKLIDISWGIKISKKNEDCIYYKQAFMLILWENWCSKDFVNKKIDTPNEVMDITKKYMDGCNSVKLFVDEYCEIVEEKKERIPARDLYNKFKGIYPGMDERSFAYNMMEMGIEKKKFKTSNQYICIKYKDNDDSDSD